MSSYSAVRIFATSQEPDYESPWQSLTPSTATGSGVVVAADRILTGAHVVANATFLQVQKVMDPDKAVARVEAICHDADLALLRVEDPKFLQGIELAPWGELPDLRDRVSVVGYPVGGDEISVTEGVVSRIEVQRYSHSQRDLLAVTVDAAINPGNSGGPVYKDGKVVGLAFQTHATAESIGEMVPTLLIRRFLAATERGVSPLVPSLGLVLQNLENPTLRGQLGLDGTDSGVLVTGVDYEGSSWGVIEPGDALLSVGGLRIANNGTVRYRDKFRTRLSVSADERFIGDRLELELLRAGRKQRVEVVLTTPKPLVERSRYDRPPTYFVWAGLVFQPLGRGYLSTWDTWWDEAPKEFLHHYYSGMRSPERTEIVILTQVLADDANVGYEGLHNQSVVMVNGKTPRNMEDFVTRVASTPGLVEIRTSDRGVIVLDNSRITEANRRILDRYRIVHDRSADLVSALPGRAD